jgi:hypothetical protein
MNENVIQKMPKIKEELIEKYRKYIQEFGDILTTDGNILFCRACNQVINRSFKKYSVTQHMSTHYHIRALNTYKLNTFNNSLQNQIQLIDCNSIEVNKNHNKLIINNNIDKNRKTIFGALRIIQLLIQNSIKKNSFYL